MRDLNLELKKLTVKTPEIKPGKSLFLAACFETETPCSQRKALNVIRPNFRCRIHFVLHCIHDWRNPHAAFVIPWDACGTHGKNSVEFLFLHRIRKLQCFFKVSRNPFPAGSDVTIKTFPFFKYRVPGFQPETFGSKRVRSAFASPMHLTLQRVKFDFLSLARFPRWRPLYRGKSWRQEANLCLLARTCAEWMR